MMTTTIFNNTSNTPAVINGCGTFDTNSISPTLPLPTNADELHNRLLHVPTNASAGTSNVRNLVQIAKKEIGIAPASLYRILEGHWIHKLTVLKKLAESAQMSIQDFVECYLKIFARKQN